jgi:hypothetical protein
VLTKPQYKVTAAHISKILKADSGRRSPINQTADWVEYVVATDGAEHLFAAQLFEYNWLQRESVDVVLVLVVVATTVIGVLVAVAWRAVKWCRGRLNATSGGSAKSKVL